MRHCTCECAFSTNTSSPRQFQFVSVPSQSLTNLHTKGMNTGLDFFLARCFPNCWGHETLPQQWWAVDTSVTYTVCPGEDLQQDHYPVFTDIIRLRGSRQGRKVKTKLRMLEELPRRWQLDTTTTSRSFYSCIHAKYFLFCYICMYTFIMNLCSIIFFQV